MSRFPTHEGDCLLEVAVAAERLGVSTSTVYRMIEAGKLKATISGMKYGKKVYESSISRYLFDNQNVRGEKQRRTA